MRVLLYTLGCKLNQCESEAIADSFTQHGFEVVHPQQKADLCIINSCTVTTKAEQKARRMVRKYASEDQKPVVLITGCYAQMEKEALKTLGERVVVVSLDDKPALLQLPLFLTHTHIASIDLLTAVKEFASQLDSQKSTPFDYYANSFTFHSRAFLKIQDGCDNRCSYCRVSIARGKAVSLESSEVISRVKTLEQSGFKEIVLTGVNISAYESGTMNLTSLIEAILDNTSDSVRIRLSSLEPDRLDSSLIELFREKRIQPHFHLPIQTASNVVLQRVNREYDVDRLYEVVRQLREVKQDPFIAADMITGLPAESDIEFEKSLNVLRELDISQLHVFPYSPRPDTELFDARDKSPESVRDQRAKRLRDLSTVHYRRYQERQVGSQAEIILEQEREGIWRGVTGNYLRIEVVNVPKEAQKGDLYQVSIHRDRKNQLIASIVS